MNGPPARAGPSPFETPRPARLLGVTGTDRRRSSERYSLVLRSRSALLTTLTDESDIAAAPIIGDSRMPKLG